MTSSSFPKPVAFTLVQSSATSQAPGHPTYFSIIPQCKTDSSTPTAPDFTGAPLPPMVHSGLYHSRKKSHKVCSQLLSYLATFYQLLEMVQAQLPTPAHITFPLKCPLPFFTSLHSKQLWALPLGAFHNLRSLSWVL